MDAAALQELHEEVVGLRRRVAYLEAALQNVEGSVEMQRLRTDVDKLKGDVYGKNGSMGLLTIINGSAELGVESLRTILNRINVSYDRLKWLIGLVGVPTLFGLISWLISILR